MKKPTFIVIGAHKAATTSLHYYFKQHPEIYVIPNKGTDILAQHYIESVEDASDYLEQYQSATDETALGEISSVYLHASKAAERIQNLFPDVKIIAILRNPAERAYSHVFHRRTYTKQELQDLQSILLHSKKFLQPGFYYSHLQKYFDVFPENQIKIFLYDEIVNSQSKFFKDIFNFIGVNPNFEPSVQERYHKGKVNINGVTRKSLNWLNSHPQIKNILKISLKPISAELIQLTQKKMEQKIPPLSDELRANLIEIYHDDILQLQKLIKLDCSHWLVGKPTASKS